MHLLPEGQWPTTAQVLGANTVALQLAVDADAGRLIVVAAVDNLTKGTGGAAVQCANLALGLPETAGLPSWGWPVSDLATCFPAPCALPTPVGRAQVAENTLGGEPGVSVTSPSGFRAAGVAAGLKCSGAADVAVVVNDGPDDSAAAVFTTNRFPAAPVQWSRQVLAAGRARAVVLNSGGANACTGPEGFQDTHATAEHAAAELGLGAIDVAVASTGLIGVRLPMDKLTAGVTDAVEGAQRRRRPRRRPRDHDHRQRAQDDGRRAGRLDRRRHGQGRRHARAEPGHDARRPHHRRARAGRGAAAGADERRRPSASSGSTPTAACRPTTPSSCWPTARAGRRRRPRSSTEALTEACTDLAMQLLADAEGSTKDIAITVRGAAVRRRRPHRRPGLRPQQPAQDGAVRQRPQLGPGARRDRHHRRRLRARPTST